MKTSFTKSGKTKVRGKLPLCPFAKFVLKSTCPDWPKSTPEKHDYIGPRSLFELE